MAGVVSKRFTSRVTPLLGLAKTHADLTQVSVYYNSLAVGFSRQITDYSGSLKRHQFDSGLIL